MSGNAKHVYVVSASVPEATIRRRLTLVGWIRKTKRCDDSDARALINREVVIIARC